MKQRMQRLSRRIEAKTDDLTRLGQSVQKLVSNPQILNLKHFKPKQFLLIKGKDQAA